MKIFTLFLLALLISVGSARIFSSRKWQGEAAIPVTSLIINGNPVTSPVPYYARIRMDYNEEIFCGGVVIDVYWVLTAARCIDNIVQNHYEVVSLLVEVGKFAQSTYVPFGSSRFRVLDILLPNGLESRNNVDKVALLHLIRKAPLYRVAPLCRNNASHGAPLRSFGLGSTSAHQVTPSSQLKEILFADSKYYYLRGVFPFVFQCPSNEICVVAVDATSSICFMDEGNPLMSAIGNLSCSERSMRNPVCVLGIASHYQPLSSSPSVQCGSSFFTSVVFYYDWIETVILQYRLTYS
ncbi:myeloblastin-like [Convolutriloba macropyga]|uniref:myeloblastin-like n=1 Tax=Convolutriloba macropyga TaxID=536237 RepID=UPI003F5268CA